MDHPIVESKLFLKAGIGRRLFAAFLAISVFSACSALYGGLGLKSLSQTQKEALQEIYPSVSNAQSLSLEVSKLVLVLSTLSELDTKEELDLKERAISRQQLTLRLLEQEAKTKVYSREFAAILLEQTKALDQDINQLFEIARKNNVLSGVLDQEINKLARTAEELIEISKGIQAQYGENLIEIAQEIDVAIDNNDNALSKELYDQFVDLNLGVLDAVSDIRFRFETVRQEIFQLDDARSQEGMQSLRANIFLNLRIITNKIVRVKSKNIQNRIARKLYKLSNDLISGNNAFEILNKILKNKNKIKNLNIFAASKSEKISSNVDDFVIKINKLMEINIKKLDNKTYDIFYKLILIAALALIISIVIYVFYINNNILYRIAGVISATRSVTNGNFLNPISISGNDEITELEVAVEGFRLNALRLSEAELELKNYADDLKRSNQDLEQFAYVTSHDLRAPLRGLDALSDWIIDDMEEGNNNEVRENVLRLKARISRMDSLLSGILQYSRAGHGSETKTTFELKPIVQGIFNDLNTENTFSLEFVSDLETIWVESTFFHQILGNLITNAVKHHEKLKGRIRLELSLDGPNYKLFVEDDGPGIPENMRERIFKIFQTLKPRDELEASGIGLALVKRIVDRQRGRVLVSESSKLGGAKFIVMWPYETK